METFLTYNRNNGFNVVESDSLEHAEMENPNVIVLDSVDEIDPIIMSRIYALLP